MGALNNPFNQIMMIFLGLAGMLWIILLFMPLIVSLILAKKYFPERRLVRVGVWFMFLLPILIFVLLFGACLVAISNGGLGF
jgi:hypothetical protein